MELKASWSGQYFGHHSESVMYHSYDSEKYRNTVSD